MTGSPSHRGRVGRWVPAVFRVVAVTMTLYPALRTFIEYSYRVQQFRAYGLPWPELAVPLTGVIAAAGTGPASHWDPTSSELLAVLASAAGRPGLAGGVDQQ